MATVAQKFPTPCTSSFWTPDCESLNDTPEASLCRRSETCPDIEATGLLIDSQESEVGGFCGDVDESSGSGGDGELSPKGPAHTHTRIRR